MNIKVKNLFYLTYLVIVLSGIWIQYKILRAKFFIKQVSGLIRSLHNSRLRKAIEQKKNEEDNPAKNQCPCCEIASSKLKEIDNAFKEREISQDKIIVNLKSLAKFQNIQQVVDLGEKIVSLFPYGGEAALVADIIYKAIRNKPDWQDILNEAPQPKVHVTTTKVPVLDTTLKPVPNSREFSIMKDFGCVMNCQNPFELKKDNRIVI